MPHMTYSHITQRRLVIFKWLMIILPSSAVMIGHGLLNHIPAGTHAAGETHSLPATLLVTLLGLVLTYLFVETVFRILRGLHREAQACEQDIQTMSAVMQERERLSRELHDGVAQLVAHLLLRLDTIKELVEADRRPEAAADLERLHGVADELYQDIGESITGLRTNLLERGLIRALQDHMDQFEERHQIPTRLRATAAADQLPPLAALQIFRLIQEALTNIRKHADAREAVVTLMADGAAGLSVIIADDGQGFIPSTQQTGKARSLGLTSMRERVEALGGTFQVQSQLGVGTKVIAAIPILDTRRETTHAALTPAPR